ncbi:late competence development protein ComFB [Cylindrospermum sp. NIES-4074]|nr:late competence development protein ComFB [Cylindrospermum sp. NIES-4074]
MPSFDLSSDSSIPHSKQQAFTKTSRNVMEVLVVEEVEKQFQSLPPKTAKYIKANEVIAYALNRLPALYATSKRGWQRQWHRGKTEMHQKITTAVRQGIIAVQQDPLRANDPLTFPDEKATQTALEGLKVLLQREDLSWENLTDVVEQTLIDTLRGEITWCVPDGLDQETLDWEQHQI